MKLKQLKLFLKYNQIDMRIRGQPLIFWTLKYPQCLYLMLERGADPNVRLEFGPDVSVTPLYYVRKTKNMRKVKRSHKKQTTQLLREYGGEYIRYSDYTAIDINE